MHPTLAVLAKFTPTSDILLAGRHCLHRIVSADHVGVVADDHTVYYR
jgi:hypothetical protein